MTTFIATQNQERKPAEMTREQLLEQAYRQAHQRSFIGRNFFNEIENLLEFDLPHEYLLEQLKNAVAETKAQYAAARNEIA